MKTPPLSVVCLFLGITSTALSQVGATAESITIHPGAVNAFTYHHCRVLKVEPDGVRIAYDRGTAHIPRKFMPSEWLAPTGTQQPPTQQPPTQPPPSLLSQLQPPPGQDLVPSAPPPGFDSPLTEPGTSDNPNVSPPFGYFIPVNLADLRVDSPKGWLDGVTNIDGKVYIPNMSGRCPLLHNITGWCGKRRLSLSANLPPAPYLVDLLFRSIEFKIHRAMDVDSWCHWYVHRGMATEAQAAEWKKVVSEERICVDMPIEIAGLAFGHHSPITSVGEGMITISNNQHWRVYYRYVESESSLRHDSYRVVKWEKWPPTTTLGTPPAAKNATVSPPAQESAANRLVPSLPHGVGGGAGCINRS